MLTTLSGDELVQLREELDLIKDSFSLVEFDDEEVDEKKGNVSVKTVIKIPALQEENSIIHTRIDVTPEMIDCTFLIPDEDGSEFERELTEALGGLSVTATADKLSKVPTTQFCVLEITRR